MSDSSSANPPIETDAYAGANILPLSARNIDLVNSLDLSPDDMKVYAAREFTGARQTINLIRPEAVMEGQRYLDLWSSTYTSDGPKRAVEAYLPADGNLWFDLDSKDDLQRGATDTLKFTSKLNELGIPDSWIKWYASGGKGFHVAVPLACFVNGGTEGLNREHLMTMPRIVRELAENLIVDSLDLNIYTRVRLFRLANVKRENGAYKVRVTRQEVSAVAKGASYDELVCAPRADGPTDEAQFVEQAGALLDRCAAKAIDAMKRSHVIASQPSTPLNDETLEAVQGALHAIPADCQYGLWRDVLFALHSTGWENAQELAREWSRNSLKFDEDEFDRQWAAIGPGDIKLGTLFHIAREHGWSAPRLMRQATNPDEVMSAPYLGQLARTELGMASAFVDFQSHSLKWVHEARAWANWDGKRWELDPTQKYVHTALRNFLDTAMVASLKLEDLDKKAALQKLLVNLQSRRAMDNIIALSTREQKMIAHIGEFDTNPDLLQVANGVIDLETGQFRAAHPDDRLLQYANVEYVANATCPRWTEFVSVIAGRPGIDDQARSDKVAVLQEIFGLCLTGRTDPQKFFNFVGGGANGKSTFLGAVTSILGTYWHALDDATLTAGTTNNKGGARPDLAVLRGKRALIANEFPEGRLDVNLIKAITGGDAISARELYGREFTFHANGKLIIASNHKPLIAEMDYGTWRRVVMVSFNHTFTVPDRDWLRTTLARETPGILAWAIDGLLRLRRNNWQFTESSEINRDTAQYRAELDVVQQWAEECVSTDVGTSSLITLTKHLYQSFSKWCHVYGRPRMGANKFSQQLRGKGWTEGGCGRRIGYKVLLEDGLTVDGIEKTGESLLVDA